MVIPLNPDKKQAPTKCLVFLGLEIDICKLQMQIRIRPGKMEEICNILEHHISKRTTNPIIMSTLLNA